MQKDDCRKMESIQRALELQCCAASLSSVALEKVLSGGILVLRSREAENTAGG